MGRLLKKGLESLRSDAEEMGSIDGLEPEKAAQLFEAIRAMTPPMRGGIDRVEVGGELVDSGSRSIVLTRDDRSRSDRRIKVTRKPARKDPPFRISSVVEEADQGLLVFTLRQLDPPDVVEAAASEIVFRFGDPLYDRVMEFFNSLERVVVVGERYDRVMESYNSLERVVVVGERIEEGFYALDIRPVDDAPSE
jgi:hypothetical protein